MSRIAEPARLERPSPMHGISPRIGSKPIRIDVPLMCNRWSRSSAKNLANRIFWEEDESCFRNHVSCELADESTDRYRAQHSLIRQIVVPALHSEITTRS